MVSQETETWYKYTMVYEEKNIQWFTSKQIYDGLPGKKYMMVYQEIHI